MFQTYWYNKYETVQFVSIQNFYKMMYYVSLEVVLYFTSANSAEPDEMPHKAAFHLDLHCLTKYLFHKKSFEHFDQRTILVNNRLFR